MRTKVEIAGAVIIVLLLLGSIKLADRINVLSDERDDALQMANDSGRVAKTYRNLFGNEVSRNRVLGTTVSNLQDLRKSEEVKHLKQFAGLKENFRNLESSIRLEADVRIQAVLARKVKHDTIYITPEGDSVTVRTYEYFDQYNHLWVAAYPDSAGVYGEIHAPIDGVMYWERAHKFLWFRVGRKEYFSEFTSPNKWVHIPQHEVMVVRKKR